MIFFKAKVQKIKVPSKSSKCTPHKPFDLPTFFSIFVQDKSLKMITLHPQYIKDNNGKKSLVVLSAKEFNTIMEELEELEDIKLYDQAKKSDNGERILFSDYLKKRKKKSD